MNAVGDQSASMPGRLLKARCDALLARHSLQKPPESRDRGMTRAGQIRALRQKRKAAKARALEEYARQACNTEAERKAAEIRIRAERKAGQLLREIEKSKGGRPGKNSPNESGSLTTYQQAKREAAASPGEPVKDPKTMDGRGL